MFMSASGFGAIIAMEIEREKEQFDVSPTTKLFHFFFGFSITFCCMSLFSIDDATHRSQTFSCLFWFGVRCPCVCVLQSKFTMQSKSTAKSECLSFEFDYFVGNMHARRWCTYAVDVVALIVASINWSIDKSGMGWRDRIIKLHQDRRRRRWILSTTLNSLYYLLLFPLLLRTNAPPMQSLRRFINLISVYICRAALPRVWMSRSATRKNQFQYVPRSRCAYALHSLSPNVIASLSQLFIFFCYSGFCCMRPAYTRMLKIFRVRFYCLSNFAESHYSNSQYLNCFFFIFFLSPQYALGSGAVTVTATHYVNGNTNRKSW